MHASDYQAAEAEAYPSLIMTSAEFQLRQAKTEIVTASKVAYRFISGVASKTTATTETQGDLNRGGPRFQGAWLKNLINPGAKPSSSDSELMEETDDAILLQPQRPME